MIERLVGSSLTSSSHGNVSALYLYAKERMNELVKDGSVTYDSDWDGYVTNYSYKTESIQSLKNELKVLNKFLEEN